MFKKIFAALQQSRRKYISAIQKDKCDDVAELLRLTIESMERNTHSTWSIAHDDDLRTLKRAYQILKTYSK